MVANEHGASGVLDCVDDSVVTGADAQQPVRTLNSHGLGRPRGRREPVYRPGDAAATLHRELLKYLTAFDWIVVDCPPSADSPLSQSALLVSDLALVPVIPSPPDLWAGVAIRQVLENVMAINEALVARLVVNQRKPRTRLAALTLELLPRYGIPVLATQIGDREAFRHAAAAGLTVR